LIGYHAAIFANCVNVGIYITNAADACAYVLENSDSEVIMVDSNKQMDKILQIWPQLPNLK
jgi:long-chain-fatty-acid--CoA ligase ACSBG